MIRVLVVDDARVFRALLRAVLEREPGVTVVGEAADGDTAVRLVRELRPDVVTMDVRMPGKDGIAAVSEIMATAPTPVVVVSALADPPDRQQVAFRALAAGALDVLPKPRSDEAGRFERDAAAIRAAVRAACGAEVRLRPLAPLPEPPPFHPAPPAAAPPPLPDLSAPLRAVGIVASTGGPATLATILHRLPATFPAPILLVQHIAQGFEPGLIHWLGGETALRVKVAEQAEPLVAGTVYVAREGRHLTVLSGAARLSDDPPLHGFRPSGTLLLESLAAAHGPGAAGLVLSGMGSDGAAGLGALRAQRAWTAAQGPRTSVVFGMPRTAIERGAACEVLEVDEIAPALEARARGHR